MLYYFNKTICSSICTMTAGKKMSGLVMAISVKMICVRGWLTRGLGLCGFGTWYKDNK